MQDRLLWTMVQACRAGGVNPARCDRQDSGDGQLLILPPGINEGSVLPNTVLGLLSALHRVNHPAGEGGRVRLRVSIGQGAVAVGATGFAAAAVVTVSRLLDAQVLRDALKANDASDAAFIVMVDLYDDLFAQGRGGLPARGFRRVRVSAPRKGFAADAWLQVPGLPSVRPAVPAYSVAARLRGRREGSSGLLLDLAAAASLTWAVLAGSGRELSEPRYLGGQPPGGHHPVDETYHDDAQHHEVADPEPGHLPEAEHPWLDSGDHHGADLHHHAAPGHGPGASGYPAALGYPGSGGYSTAGYGGASAEPDYSTAVSASGYTGADPTDYNDPHHEAFHYSGPDLDDPSHDTSHNYDS